MGLTPDIDVADKDLLVLRELFANHLPDTEVWAFGSRVKGTARKDSDLDLVVFSKPDQKSKVHALREALDESALPFRVDVLVWDDISEAFRENIRKKYWVLVSGKLAQGSCGI